MDLPATLIQRLKSGMIVPFVGAGISRSVKAKNSGTSLFPSWFELLERAAIRLQRENKSEYATLVQSLIRIDKPDFLRAAEYARNALGSIWYEFLKEQFDYKREASEDDGLKDARQIWQLGSKLVITTNYDRVLRWTCPDPSDLGIWTWFVGI